MNTQGFIEYLCEEGMDTSSIISFVHDQDNLIQDLIKFLKRGVAHTWMNKPWEPSAILTEAIRLGLVVHEDNCVKYSDYIKKVAQE